MDPGTKSHFVCDADGEEVWAVLSETVTQRHQDDECSAAPGSTA